MNDEERKELAAQLDNDLDNFISGLEKSPYTEGWPEDKWEEEMEKHPFFMSKLVEDGKELPPLVQGLQDLKYDPDQNTPEELAASYKEDGNYNFGLKKYRFAVDNYTAGLKQKCSDELLNVQLYCNRAAAHYHLKNYRSSFRDTMYALKLKPDHMKAIIRSCQCLFQLTQYKLCMDMCERGLGIEKEQKELTELRKKAEHEKRLKDRDDRKSVYHEKKREKQTQEVKNAIADRGIILEECKGELKVKLSPNGDLIWPVVFLYPEYGQSDLIEEFNENDKFEHHLETMFGSESDRPGWDQGGRYLPNNINIFTPLSEYKQLLVNPNMTLRDVLTRIRHTFPSPCFFIMVKDCDAEKHFLEKQKVERC